MNASAPTDIRFSFAGPQPSAHSEIDRALHLRHRARLARSTRPATLIDEDLTVDFSRETTPSDLVTVVATRPLTRGERRTAVAKRSLIAFRDGTMIVSESPSSRIG